MTACRKARRYDIGEELLSTLTEARLGMRGMRERPARKGKG